MEFLSAEKFGGLFYVVSVNKTTFKNLEEVPNYFLEMIPWLIVFITVERIFFLVNKKPLRLNDLAASGMLGTVQEILRLVLDGWKYAAYIYIYTNWRIVTLPWDSVWTWWVAFIVADFLYYWTHRASHEINFIWASHQVHHSSEDYTFSSALRQSVLLNQILWLLYLPVALIVPPAAFLVHFQLNFLYQFWIHTEIIRTIGPLEYVLNTASHHRVHHGRNRYCIDKNYAGVLIIWDRMFGTFEAEKEKEEIAYGLINTSNTFEPLYIQFGYTLNVLKKFWSTENWRDKLSVLFKGPGWSPGKPWHGNAEDIPVNIPYKKYDPPLPLWRHLYAIVHVASVVIAYATLHRIQHALTSEILYGIVAYLVISLASIGILLDGRPYASILELMRCLAYIAVDYYFSPYILMNPCLAPQISHFPPVVHTLVLGTIRCVFLASGLIWMTSLMNSWLTTRHSKKGETIKKKQS